MQQVYALAADVLLARRSTYCSSHFLTGIEETWQIKQQRIVSAVESGAARKAFDLSLPELGPYSMAYSRNGRHMVLGGERGHLAVMDWQTGHLTCEVQVSRTQRPTKAGSVQPLQCLIWCLV